MRIVKLEYLDGTHYVNSDKDRHLLVVKNNGRIDLRCKESDIPEEVLKQANAESKLKREEFTLKWNKLGIHEKYCKLLDYFSNYPQSQKEANYDWSILNPNHLSMEDFIAKWEGYYIENVY